MRSRSTNKILCLLSLVFSAALMTAQTGGAMLSVTGRVMVNGSSVEDFTSIFPGDRLDTANSSLVSLNRTGSSVVVNPNSTIQYEQSTVDVIRGAAHISTMNGMSAHAGPIAVIPNDKAAKFDIVRLDNSISVTSRSGALTVIDGSRTSTLEPGESIALAIAAKSSAVLSQGRTTMSVRSAGILDPLSAAPFYTNVGTLGDDNLPWCPSLHFCKRPNVSKIRPCRCPKLPPTD